MTRNTELLFVRRMMENLLDQGEREQVMALSRRIDELMQERIRREGSCEAVSM